MAQLSWPSPDYNTRAVNDSEYEALSARFADDGIDGRPSDPAVVTAGAGLSVNVRADVYGNVRGRAWYSGSTTVNIAIGANASGATRIDRIVLRLDRADWTVRAVPKTGTPGAGAPALSQALGETGVYEVPLARVTVLAGAAAVSVTREELFIGTRFRPCTSSTRNPNPTFGEGGVEYDTGRVIFWDGAAWRILYSHSGPLEVNASISSWRVSADSVLEERNGNVHLRLGAFERTGGGVSNEVRLPVLIPATYRHPGRGQYGIAYLTGGHIGRLEVYAGNTTRAGQVWLTQFPPLAKGDYVMPGSGISWVVE
ncbi:hypothetical protein [Streptomyces anthocyanicus]|uniref:hypothetical protein n=1 Tax=Streptomyces anthocyanicus TaxID=68174 RepID=UPI003820FE10